jgi:CBS domain-containing protein
MVPAHVYLDPAPRHHRTVEDVMTTSVVTADRHTPYQEIVRLLAEYQISGLPVLAMGWQVVGVVSEADLLAAEDDTSRQARIDLTLGQRRRFRRPRRLSLTAGELMTTPAITIRPGETIPAAARAMNRRHLRRLPVTGAEDTLIGIVTRRDLLSVFLRPDADIVRDVRRILDASPLGDPAHLIVTVRHGVVTLTGTIQPRSGWSQDHGNPRGFIPPAMRLIWDVDGVVDVVVAKPAAG